MVAFVKCFCIEQLNSFVLLLISYVEFASGKYFYCQIQIFGLLSFRCYYMLEIVICSVFCHFFKKIICNSLIYRENIQIYLLNTMWTKCRGLTKQVSAKLVSILPVICYNFLATLQLNTTIAGATKNTKW